MNIFRAVVERDRVAKALSASAVIIMGGTLVWRFAAFVRRSLWAVITSRELDYGEGIVWQQMRMITSGHGYSPLKAYPAIVFHYPPLYHLVTFIVTSITPWGDLAAGRIVSLVSTVIAAALVGSIAALISSSDDRITRWICGMTAALICLSCYPVAVWAPYMRVDMLASALSMSGLLFAMLSLRRPRLIYLASCFFVASVFTKQTMVAAPAASFLVLLILKPRLAIRGIAMCLGVGVLVLAGLSAITGGEFARHIFGYNINRFSLVRLHGVLHIVRQHVAYIIAGLLGAAVGISKLMTEVKANSAEGGKGWHVCDTSIQCVIATSYVAVSALTLILVGKSGSTINYYIEWFLAGSILAGAAACNSFKMAFRPSGTKISIWAVLLIGVGVPALVSWGALTTPIVKAGDQSESSGDQAELDLLIREIREARRPVISDDMVIVRQAGKQVVLEPAIVAELTATKVYDERPLLQMISSKDFAFFVTKGEHGQTLFDSRYSPAVAKAMSKNYPRLQKIAGVTVHWPDNLP